jgi:ATP phosphoribosyltransferase
MEYLTFALAKGRLAELAMDRLASIGIDCAEMKEKSRKLIFVNEELKLKFFLSKANDVPTYVEYGAADIGIAGRDTLMEEKRKTYELLDLGFGKCRIVVAGKADSADKIYKNNNLRVATKYPNIARDYFYNQKQQTVEIIKLNGSVELGPIVGLADVIVDIVETGSTLKENGLVVIDEIADVSARMIVNRVSMKMEHDRVSDIIKKLKGIL